MTTTEPTTVHDAIKALHIEQPDTYELAILHGLQTKPFYQGTVEPHVKASRRAKNKVAKASRKKNRA